MNSHCHSSSYPSYQPSSPYRPHPISPQAHSHQYNNHVNHQMHSGMVYGTGHQLGPYASAPQAHFGTQTQDMYSTRRNIYSTGNRNVQQVKSAWIESGNSGNSDLMQNYNQSSPRPTMLINSPHMPPPSIRSPPHGTVSNTATPTLVPTHHHYRPLPVGSSPNQSPHSWTQTQIPSPSLLHSPRTTPSPLPNHARSPGHNQPFSPPPTTPSPHHPSTSITPHQTQVKIASPSNSNCQTLNQSGSDPLQSLQKMVMLETDSVESPMTRVNYEIPNSHSNSQSTRCYFSSVEQLAGSNPGSPYPTYYNLDQNRLCTPPNPRMSTPTTPTYSSAPDSVSNSSISNDSRTSLSCPDVVVVNQQNGEVNHSHSTEINTEKHNSVSKDKVVNGEQEKSLEETVSDSINDTKSKLGQKKNIVSDSKENCISWNNKFSGKKECPLNEIKHAAISSSRNKKSSNHEDESDYCSSPHEAIIEKQLKSKTILSPSKRNLIIQEISVSNGPVSNCGDINNDGYLQNKLNCTSPKWNNNEACDDNHNMDIKEHLSQENSLIFTKQSSSTGLSSQRTSTQCNLIWIRKDVKSNHINDDSPSEMINDKNNKSDEDDDDSSDDKESLENEIKKSFKSKIPSTAQKFGDFGISNFLGKEEKKESWQHPDLYVGPSPSDERSDECMPNESNVVNTSVPLKATSEPLVIPSGENTSPEIKLNKNSKDNTSEEFSIRESSDLTNDDHTPSHSRSVDSPPKKKRGRPFGSKNKPKSQSDKSDKKKRKKNEVVDAKESEQKKKSKAFSGPHVHVTGTRDKPLSITVVNVAPKEEEKYVKYQKQKRDFHVGNNLHKKLGVGHTSTLSPLYDAFTKDKTWVCALCQKGSHYRSLGDLFGPYYFKEEHTVAMSSNCTLPTDNMKNIQKDTNITNKNVVLNRKVRSKRKRSELVEEFIKTSMSKKSKQPKKPESEVVSPEASIPSTTAPITIHEGNEFWIHEDCALWSHGVCLNGQRIHGLEDAVKEASVMICSKCKLRGATLGCLNKGCTEQYHYICAADKGCDMDEENFSLLCPRHRKRSHGEKRVVIE